MLGVELGSQVQATKKPEHFGSQGTQEARHSTCTALKKWFPFDLCLQLLRVTGQTRVVRKPMQIKKVITACNAPYGHLRSLSWQSVMVMVTQAIVAPAAHEVS